MTNVKDLPIKNSLAFFFRKSYGSILKSNIIARFRKLDHFFEEIKD
jgi:hypothetical protein